MFSLDEINCIIAKAEDSMSLKAIRIAEESCFTTEAKLSLDDIALWQLLFLSKRNPASLDTCLINKLKKHG